MLPTTVGELKKFLANHPDDMPFELEVNSAYGIHEVSLDVEKRRLRYNGTKCDWEYGNFLVLNVKMDS